jgi:hypothetical protein
MHKGIGLNRQDAKVSEEDSPRTHAALTGRCRSGGSADTLMCELIRLSGCPATHVRVADSAAGVSNLKILCFLAYLWLIPLPTNPSPCSLRLRVSFSASASICGFFLGVLGVLAVQSIRIHPCLSVFISGSSAALWLKICRN